MQKGKPLSKGFRDTRDSRFHHVRNVFSLMLINKNMNVFITSKQEEKRENRLMSQAIFIMLTAEDKEMELCRCSVMASWRIVR